MVSPSTSIVRLDLSGPFSEFSSSQDRQGFIAGKILHPVPVAVSEGEFSLLPIEAVLREETSLRGPHATYQRIAAHFGTSSFKTREYGLESLLDDRTTKLYRELIDAEQVAVERAVDGIARQFEKQAADLIFDTTTWTGESLTTAVSKGWRDYSNATPIEDVAAAVNKVWDGCGLWPNALVISKKTFLALRLCDEVTDRLTASGAGAQALPSQIGPQQLAELFDLDFAFVGGAARNTANDPQAAVISPIWNDDYAMVCRAATGRDLGEPCVARAFQWSDDTQILPDGGQIGYIAEQYREETTRGNVFRARSDWDMRVILKEAGHLLTNVSAEEDPE